MIAFIISLAIYIIFSLIGGFLGLRIPKFLIIPEPIVSFVGWGIMITTFYYENDRLLQILISFVSGFIIANCIKD